MVKVGRQFAERVRRLREEQGLTQRDLARALKIHQTNYAKLERGERKVTLDEAADIARALGQPLGFLVGDPQASEKEQALREALLIDNAQRAVSDRDLRQLRAQAEHLRTELMLIEQRTTLLTKQEAYRKKRIEDIERQLRAFTEGD